MGAGIWGPERPPAGLSGTCSGVREEHSHNGPCRVPGQMEDPSAPLELGSCAQATSSRPRQLLASEAGGGSAGWWGPEAGLCGQPALSLDPAWAPLSPCYREQLPLPFATA